MPEIPTPIRAYLGLLDAIVANGRGLVGRTPELPAILVGNALQLSMRATQTYAELATRGDMVLSRLHRTPEDSPPWATFDDEQEVTATATRAPALAGLSVVRASSADGPDLLNAEPFALPAAKMASPTDTVATATRATSSRTAASRTAASRTAASRTPASRTAASRTAASRTAASRTAASPTAADTPATKAPTRKVPATRASATRASATRAPATRAPAHKAIAKEAPSRRSTSTPGRPRGIDETERLKLDPRAGAGDGGARPLSAFDRVGSLTDDLLAEAAAAQDEADGE